MEERVIDLLKQELNEINPKNIDSVLNLLADGNTIPFIARYRKEMTGSLDEVELRLISDRHSYLESLEKRKEEVSRLIEEQGKLTEELSKDIANASVLQTLEDLYRPYKQKRRTKAVIAKEMGLEPLALELLKFNNIDIQSFASGFISEEIESAEAALLGAHEIMAEMFGDVAEFRSWIRDFTFKNGMIKASLKKQELDTRSVYEMYYEFEQTLRSMQGHRVLAINRAEKEDVIKVDVVIDEEAVASFLERRIVGNKFNASSTEYVRLAYLDAYKRFIKPAIEREIRNELSEKADQGAIHVFGENLRNLLLQAPLKGRVVMGFDPAYRSGCKLAIVDETGKVLKIQVIYPHAASESRMQDAALQFRKLVETYNVDMIAIGNGTASRESEVFVAENLKLLKNDVFYLIVNEAGASVYSASELARKEFPDLQVEERSAISIARRIQDPLAELVKIDPQSVGVGQYQHDVSQKNLKDQLDFVVETAVNQVGVDINTASPQLLEHVAGLTKTTAQNIVLYREEHGSFVSRTAIKTVPRLGPKSYEQSVGFLRIPNAKNVLDSTGIHPETYTTAKAILKELGLKLSDLGTEEATNALASVSINNLSDSLDVGKETLGDILEAMQRPGRDLREDMEGPLLRSDVLSLEDLKEGMELNGTVRNVVDFGAFVDVGVKQDGLVHISKLSKNFVKHPSDIVAVGDVVKVWVESVDVAKSRIQLSMIEK